MCSDALCIRTRRTYWQETRQEAVRLMWDVILLAVFIGGTIGWLMVLDYLVNGGIGR